MIALVHPILQKLWNYRHFRNPSFPETHNVQEEDLTNLGLGESVVRQALLSWQDIMAVPLDGLCQKHHKRMAVHDGELGPATEESFDLPRCGHPDYLTDEETARAIGSGQWKGCHDIGEFHAASVRVTNSPPSFLAPLFDQVKKRVTKAYDEIGLRFYWDQRDPHQIDFSFVPRSSGWIGLAIVGSAGLSCESEPIWCRYLSTYRGGSSRQDIIEQWTTLVKHELGHNCGTGHTRGGVMNPSILSGLPVSWKNDPLWDWLVDRFGGEPVPDDDPDPDPEPDPDPPPQSVRGTLNVGSQEYLLIGVPK